MSRSLVYYQYTLWYVYIEEPFSFPIEQKPVLQQTWVNETRTLMSHRIPVSHNSVNKICQQKENGNVHVFSFLKFRIWFCCLIASLGINSKTRQACFVMFLLWRILKKNLFAPVKVEKIWINSDTLSWFLPPRQVKQEDLHFLSNWSHCPQWILHIHKYIYDASLAWHDE